MDMLILHDIRTAKAAITIIAKTMIPLLTVDRRLNIRLKSIFSQRTIPIAIKPIMPAIPAIPKITYTLFSQPNLS